MTKIISKADFENAPSKYKGEFTDTFNKISDLYEERLKTLNRNVTEPEDMLNIIQIEAYKGSEDKLVDAINRLEDSAKEVLIIGKPKYGVPKYVIIIGPISDRDYFEYFQLLGY